MITLLFLDELLQSTVTVFFILAEHRGVVRVHSRPSQNEKYRHIFGVLFDFGMLCVSETQAYSRVVNPFSSCMSR